MTNSWGERGRIYAGLNLGLGLAWGQGAASLLWKRTSEAEPGHQRDGGIQRKAD